VTKKLKVEAEALGGEGWKWIAVAPDLPYGHTAGMRRLEGQAADLTGEEHASREALRSEFDELEQKYAGADELPEEVDDRSRATRYPVIAPSDRHGAPCSYPNHDAVTIHDAG